MKNLDKIDEGQYGIKLLKSTPPKGHQGYSPVMLGKILGRYKYHDVAELKGKGAPIMTYEDACRRTGTKFVYHTTTA